MSTDPADDSEAAVASLVMPFVVVQSEGGPFDDESYSAGYEMGHMWCFLQMVTGMNDIRNIDLMVRSANVPQADLVAMHFGYVTEVKPCPGMEDEWSAIELRKADR